MSAAARLCGCGCTRPVEAHRTNAVYRADCRRTRETRQARTRKRRQLARQGRPVRRPRVPDLQRAGEVAA